MTDDQLQASDATEIEPDMACGRPAHIPEKFWDEGQNELRTEALLQSYSELEKRLGQSLAMPTDDNPEALQKLYDALGRPATPEEYQLAEDLADMEPDPELNAALHAAGFSQSQANLVYKLASERLQPLIENMQSEVASAKERLRLEQQFGGAERFAQVATDLKNWGHKRFGEDAFEAITASYDGVMALHAMMGSSEPSMVGNSSEDAKGLSREQLNSMMADPRYWRDRDPEFIKSVTAGFSELYPD